MNLLLEDLQQVLNRVAAEATPELLWWWLVDDEGIRRDPRIAEITGAAWNILCEWQDGFRDRENVIQMLAELNQGVLTRP